MNAPPVLLMGFEFSEIPASQIEHIRQLAQGYDVVVTHERAEMEAVLEEIEIAVGSVPYELLLQAPRLKWFQQWGAGADWLLRYPAAVRRDFVLTNASGVHAIPISEQIIGTLLMFARGLHTAVRYQTRNQWQAPDYNTLFELPGKRMLLVGVGAIGAHTATLATALGMEVEGIRRNPTRSVPGVARMYGLESLHERLPSADVVVLTLPLSQATTSLINEAVLRQMKPTAYFINIGRGGTIDEAALVRALQEKWIAGAALDVFTEEPLPESSPLWALDNVIITAHYAGATPHYNERAIGIFMDNLELYLAGEPLRNQVDKSAGY